MVIVLKIESIYGNRFKIIFEGYFYNESIEIQAWFMVDGIGYYH